MGNNFYTDVIIIVFIQSLLLFIYALAQNKYRKKSDPLDEKLKTLEAIMTSTKHDKIVHLEHIKELEQEAEEVFVFSKDLYRDVKDSGQFSQDLYNVGTFYETVKNNLLNDKVQYKYFLKEDSHWKHFVYSFLDSYRDITDIENKVGFYMIPSNRYYFYDEIYLYKMKDETYIAYEFLPSISDEKKQILFYLELDEKQKKRLVTIKDELMRRYSKNTLSTLIVDLN